MALPTRCFVAVAAPPELADRLRALERPSRPGLRWTPEEQWHVTLGFFEAVDPDALLDALGARAASPAGLPAVEAVAGPAPRALARRVWILPVEGLSELAAAVGEATAGLDRPPPEPPPPPAPPGPPPPLGPPPPPRSSGPFRGHLTLARARYPSALRRLPRPDLVVRWQVPEIMAVRSELRSDGARHEVLRRWPLPRP